MGTEALFFEPAITSFGNCTQFRKSENETADKRPINFDAAKAQEE
jgi:hypothetical protein